VRGDTIVLLGEVDKEKHEEMKLKKVTTEELAELSNGNSTNRAMKQTWEFEDS
jgi:hypothetical protein